MVASLPLPFRLANADAALEIVRHRLEMAEQRTLLEQDPGNDARFEKTKPLRLWNSRTRRLQRLENGLEAISRVLVLDLRYAQLKVVQRCFNLRACGPLTRDFRGKLHGLVAVARVECGAE